MTAMDGVITKKSSSIWSHRDHPCEHCGKIFTQSHSLIEHKKYACKNLVTQPRLKVECPNCNKKVTKLTVSNHRKNGCPAKKQKKDIS